MKYLIVGLGNIGAEYANTRHNIGFMVLDAFAKASGAVFYSDRYADRAEVKYRGRTLILIKPTTFMNLSGKAVNYWAQQEKIPIENILVIVDDLALPFGVLRLRQSGSEAGHNGLKNITEMLGTQNYARLRFGIGSEFQKGRQVDYVLGKFSYEDIKRIETRTEVTTQAIYGFVIDGIQRTMNNFNGK
ncbi:MAG: aminoacyl-tRNA hydrolase [Bacteroidales bacterium]|nr:aminoacyl-tRNA hydrolase [Bacteroidales bacterium]MBR6277828.1 aminoacyl-tRNA hydrolase [Bacteroidales bacterium]